MSRKEWPSLPLCRQGYNNMTAKMRRSMLGRIKLGGSISAARLTLAFTAASAQQAPLGVVGDRVRIHLRGDDGTVAGTLVRAEHDTLRISACPTCEARAIPRGQISTMDRSTGKKHSVHRIILGALGGGLAGAGAWLAFVQEASAGCHDGPCGAGVIFTPAAAAVGAVAGAVTGWALREETWTPTQMPPE